MTAPARMSLAAVGRTLGVLVLVAVVLAVAAVVSGGRAESSAGATPGPADAPQYYFDQWHVESLWAQGFRGQGVTIAALDTGVNAAVPELRAKLLDGTDFGTGPVGTGNGQTDRDTDQFGHGTAMASLMVADPGTFGIAGIAPAARVLPIALPLLGTEDAAADDQLPQAIRYAADHGANIISMSLGETRKPGSDPMPCAAADQDAIFYAMAKGAILVAASGNQGQQGSPVVDPGVCLGVLSVGAVDSFGRVAAFSSRHPYLTLTAPGVAIASLSRVPGRAYSGDGTSQATALTAAGLALVKSAHPELTAGQLVARVLETLTPAPGTPAGTQDPAYGYGRLAVDRAVLATVAVDAPNPVYAAAAPFIARYQAGLAATAAPAPPSPAPAPAAGPLPTGAPPPRVPARVWWTVAVALAGGLLIGLAGWAGRRRAASGPPVSWRPDHAGPPATAPADLPPPAPPVDRPPPAPPADQPPPAQPVDRPPPAEWETHR